MCHLHSCLVRGAEAGWVVSSPCISGGGWLNIGKAAALAALVLFSYYFLLPRIIKLALPLPSCLRFLVTFAAVAPLGICLGMLFPQGLKKLHARKQDLIPWAWALNGYMSLVGSMISYYLSMHTGFASFFLIAACLYLSVGIFRIKF